MPLIEILHIPDFIASNKLIAAA